VAPMPGSRRTPLQQIGHEVFLSTGRGSNWVLIREGRDLTLIDSGYPADGEQVLADIASLGCTPADVRAVLLTHGHIDHVGGLGTLLAEHDVPVWAHRDELPNLHGEVHEQAGAKDILMNLAMPHMWSWIWMLLHAGGLTPVDVPSAQDIGARNRLDLPGHPEPLPTPGHTSGHAAYLLREAGILVTGDALITGHQLSRHEGPQLIPAFFDHHHGPFIETLSTLCVQEADVIAPGHGPVWRGDLGYGVRKALADAPLG
jgi:glyoxylase-like metal-dependent hydrolase (beta-lactamase superfamily II)